MANRPIFSIVMLFALIPSLVTATSLSSYSMNIINTVYGSVIPQQGEGTIPQQGEGIIPQQGEGTIGGVQNNSTQQGQDIIPQQGEGTIGGVQNNRSILNSSI